LTVLEISLRISVGCQGVGREKEGADMRKCLYSNREKRYHATVICSSSSRSAVGGKGKGRKEVKDPGGGELWGRKYCVPNLPGEPPVVAKLAEITKKEE